MPDLEDLIRRTLNDRASLSPGMQHSLLANATAMRQRRRRTVAYAAISAAMTAAAAVAIPLAVMSAQRDTSHAEPATTGTASTRPATTSAHVGTASITFGDLTIRAPRG